MRGLLEIDVTEILLVARKWRLAWAPNKSLQRTVNHKVLYRGRVLLAPCRAVTLSFFRTVWK
jgi:hypothetical protein